MPQVELSAGTIEYEDTGGDGPVVVLVHGLMMGGSIWREVVAELRDGHRCIVPTMPLGAHRLPMRPDADLSLKGQAQIIGELLDRLDLRDVTLVQNDLGAALVVAGRRHERLGRLVLASVEAFGNYPPGLPGRNAKLLAALPGGASVMLRSLKLGLVRRSPLAFGWMSKHPIPDDVFDGWIEPALRDAEIRRDMVRYIRSARRRDMVEVTESVRAFDRPALVVWAAEDRVMPPKHGRQLAELLPDARYVEIADSYTLLPVDQPAALARAIREFVRETAPVAGTAS